MGSASESGGCFPSDAYRRQAQPYCRDQGPNGRRQAAARGAGILLWFEAKPNHGFALPPWVGR
jgi:hypothetical protein